MSAAQSHPLDSYTVGWICALSTEYVAACEILDEEHEQLAYVPPNDNNSYTLGKIGGHHVVIGVLPDGEYGTSSAAAVATDMVRTFQHIRLGLMVGIGGGAPSSAHDIRLGDVVVSSPTAGRSGVFQYDYGKAIQDQEFRETGVLDQPPRVIRAAVSSLKAQHERKGHRLREATEAIVVANQRLRKKYSRPKPESEKLYKAHVVHPQIGDRDCIEVCSRNEEDIEDRLLRTEEDDDPMVHYGLIASGNNLMRDARVRDRFAQEYNVLCFEMEAAGLVNHFRCLVIRGICDYSDSHKNKMWQGYAAMTAAAYAKELLLRIPIESVHSIERLSQLEQLQTTVDIIRSDVQDAARSQRQQVEHYLSDQHHSCHQTFKTSTYEAFKNRNLKRALTTCSWVLQHPRYLTWRDSPVSDLLWISADPGCGKSVLAKAFVDDPEFLPKTRPSVCYFFFKENEEQDNLAIALNALLHQLFSQQPELISYAIEDWKKDGQSIRYEIDTLWRILITSCTSPEAGPTVCVLDALDECRDRERHQLVNLLCNFNGSTTEKSLKFVVTSRPYGDLEQAFRLVPGIRLRGEDESEALRKEINLVIKQRIEELTSEIPLREKIKQRLGTKLLGIPHRTYLWIDLVTDYIRETYSASLNEEEASFEMIPPTVEDAYEQILSKVPSAQVQKVRKVLGVVVGARRPLSVGELQYALGIALNGSSSELQSTVIRKDLKKWIRHYCGLFISFHDSKAYLIHQTAKEFLICHGTAQTQSWKWSFSAVDNEHLMGKICIIALCAKEFQEHELNAEETALSIKDRSKDLSKFLTYCAQFWLEHFQESYDSLIIDVRGQIDHLHDVQNGSFSRWFTIAWNTKHKHVHMDYMNSIRLCCYTGHRAWLEEQLCQRKHQINARDNYDRNALYWCAFMGREAIARLLLDKGAQVDAQPDWWSNPLHAASENGHVQVVQLLLENGANINLHTKDGRQALELASRNGYKKIVRLLLDKGALIDSQSDPHGNNALVAAIKNDQQQVIQLLLDKYAEENITGRSYGCALETAISRGHLQLARQLFDRGADVNIGAQGGALQRAILGSHLDLIKPLLDRGADIHMQGGRFGTALQAAAFKDHRQLVRDLLDRGADINAQGGHYGTALQAAVYKGYRQLVRDLLDRGAEINAQGGHYGTALQAAVYKGYRQLVRDLLDRGADINAQGGYYGTTLQAAASKDYRQLVRDLLDRGADINAQGGNFHNALDAAWSKGYEQVVLELLSRGADVNTIPGKYDKTTGGTYGNALQAASYKGYEQVVQGLLDSGVDVNAEGGEYGNALQAASSQGYIRIVSLLIDRGAIVNQRGGYYGNALQAASSQEDIRIVSLLIDRSAIVNQRGGYYGTALQAASSQGYIRIVSLLIDRGAIVNQRGGHHGSALRAAAIKGHESTVQLLRNNGARASKAWR